MMGFKVQPSRWPGEFNRLWRAASLIQAETFFLIICRHTQTDADFIRVVVSSEGFRVQRAAKKIYPPLEGGGQTEKEIIEYRTSIFNSPQDEIESCHQSIASSGLSEAEP